MSSYRVFCNDCGVESFISFIEEGAEAKFCPQCASELDESDISEDEDFDEDAWDRLSEESLDDLDDWKTNG